MATQAFQRQEPNYMFRKTIIATAAIATLVTAALPSTASAHRRHHGHGFGIGFIDTSIYVGGGCRTVYEWRQTRHGRLYQVPVTYCY
jgi:predicted glutamine amidotransferase